MKKQSPPGNISPKYFKLINTFIKSKKEKGSSPVSLDFLSSTDLGYYKIPNFSVKMEHIKGQVEFYALTEEKNFLNLDEFNQKDYFAFEQSSYWFYRNRRDGRYYLSSLINDLIKIKDHKKLVYIILFSPKTTNTIVFTLDKVLSIEVTGSSNVDFSEEGKDSLDEYYEYMSKIKNPCPDCGNKWNNQYCYCCGYPH